MMLVFRAAVGLLAAGALFGAQPAPAPGNLDPALLRHVPAESRVLAGIDMARLAGSPSGRALFSLLQASYPRLSALNEWPGFDPLRDARQILLAAAGQANANHTVILMRGEFDRAAMEARGFRMEVFENAPLLRPQRKDAPCFAILEAGVAALGSQESLHRLLVRRNSADQPDAGLLARAQELSGRYDFWAVSIAPSADLAATVPEGQWRGILRGDVLAAVQESRLGIEAGDSNRLIAEAVLRTAKDAAALAEVVRFFAGVLQLTEKIRGSKAPPAAGLLENLQVQTEGNLMRATLVLSGAQLQTLVRRARDLDLLNATPPPPAP
ncbi:MAG: hypothetical protein K6T61_01750 [Bryobacteraceae bacterium]|nr:hypothetical protein [Bryobacteraceae bacterium]